MAVVIGGGLGGSCEVLEVSLVAVVTDGGHWWLLRPMVVVVRGCHDWRWSIVAVETGGGHSWML